MVPPSESFSLGLTSVPSAAVINPLIKHCQGQRECTRESSAPYNPRRAVVRSTPARLDTILPLAHYLPSIPLPPQRPGSQARTLPTVLTFNLKRKQGPGTCGLRGAYPTCTCSVTAAPVPVFWSLETRVETKFPPLAAPSSLSRAVGAEPQGRPSPTPRPRATGVRAGRRGGAVSAEPKEPRRLGPCRISPPPLRILSRLRTAPAPLPPGGKETRCSLSPRTLQTSAS